VDRHCYINIVSGIKLVPFHYDRVRYWVKLRSFAIKVFFVCPKVSDEATPGLYIVFSTFNNYFQTHRGRPWLLAILEIDLKPPPRWTF
jgi:hypothetical protein